jgi:hypothetical protein
VINKSLEGQKDSIKAAVERTLLSHEVSKRRRAAVGFPKIKTGMLEMPDLKTVNELRFYPGANDKQFVWFDTGPVEGRYIVLSSPVLIEVSFFLFLRLTGCLQLLSNAAFQLVLYALYAVFFIASISLF